MKVGVNALAIPHGELAEAARAAEALGYESLWMPDHLVFPSATQSRYPYSADGSSPVGPAAPFPDPLVTLSYVAAVTSRLKLGTAVYILPLRNPVASAKLASTVDALSGGRLVFGLGAGWMAEEFAIAGELFDDRQARLEESVAVIRALWSDGAAAFHGRFYDFEDAHMQPKPVQKPHPPLLFGGETTSALRRAARLGDGWIGMHHTPETLSRTIERLARYRDEAGTSAGRLEITLLGGAAPAAATIQALGQAGADRVIVYPFRRGNSAIDDLTDYAQSVLAKV